MASPKTTALARSSSRSVSAPEFHRLAAMPPEAEWLLNITNERTRRAYKNHVGEFIAFFRLKGFDELRTITRAHVIRWRDELKSKEPAQSAATIRAKISALSSLFGYLSEKNAVTHNPVKGVKRPTEGSNEGKTPAISDSQARKLLEIPSRDTLKGKRDHAMISTFLHHGLRREELSRLNVNDIIHPRGVPHLRVRGKRDKVRNVELHPATAEAIHVYLEAAGHADDTKGPLFRPLRNNTTKVFRKHLHTQSIAAMLHGYAVQAGIDPEAFSAHALRVTAATKAHENGADLRHLQEWLGHASPQTTGLYIRRRYKPEDSPTFKTNY